MFTGNSMNWEILTGLTLFFAGTALMIYGMSRPNRIELTGDSLVIRGSYGQTVSIDEIQSCEMLEKMPEITLRTNGIGLPNVRIGHFRVSGIGKCRLYINLKYPPFVHVTTDSGKHIFFNTKDPEVTAGLFEAISDSIKPAHHE